MSQKKLTDWVIDSSDKKRNRSASESGISPSAKMVIRDADDDDVFSPPIDAPNWAKGLILAMKKVTRRMEELTDRFDVSLREVNEKFEDLKSETKAELTVFSDRLDNIEKESTKKVQYLSQTVQFTSDAYDDQRLLNEAFQYRLAALGRTVDEQKSEIDQLEQYGHRNCLVVHGIDEVPNEDTTQLVINNFAENLGVTVTPQDVGRSHRLGRENNKKKRPIIVKFARYAVRADVYRNKKKLKGKSFMITESLTRHRLDALTSLRNTHGPTKVWTQDGNIFREGNKRGEKCFVPV